MMKLTLYPAYGTPTKSTNILFYAPISTQNPPYIKKKTYTKLNIFNLLYHKKIISYSVHLHKLIVDGKWSFMQN